MRAYPVLLPLLLCTVLGGAFLCCRMSGANRIPAAAAGIKTLPAYQPPALPPAAQQPEGPADANGIRSYEYLMYAQPPLVDAQLRHLRAQTPGKPDLYAVGFAGDAEEGVFRNEVEYLPKLLAGRFDAADRTLQLVNSTQTFEHVPLATRTNLDHALAGLAETMDRDDDILLLFLTSHGSRDHHLLVEMGSLPLDQLTPREIRDALDHARIKWRVIVVSACFSGGFMPELREPHTMVITAAREDRTSFGCGSDSQITWFGKAFLTEALNRTTDFHEAFLQASKTIAAWEKRDGETPSEPQYWEGPMIGAKLAAWRKTLPATQVQVPFVPPAVESTEHKATGK